MFHDTDPGISIQIIFILSIVIVTRCINVEQSPLLQYIVKNGNTI